MQVDITIEDETLVVVEVYREGVADPMDRQSDVELVFSIEGDAGQAVLGDKEQVVARLEAAGASVC